MLLLVGALACLVPARRAAGTDAVRVWETAFDRAYYLAQESVSRELTADEQEFLKMFRKEHPDSARGIDALIEASCSSAERITASAG